MHPFSLFCFSKHMQAIQAYEAQVSSLVRGMSRLEEELHKAQEEKAALLADLASVRELCVKLDSSKELTARQLTSRSMDLERVRLAVVPAYLLPCFFWSWQETVHILFSFKLNYDICFLFLGYRRTGGCPVRGGDSQEAVSQRAADCA